MATGRVCIDGISSAVGARIVDDLLARGYTVHACINEPGEATDSIERFKRHHLSGYAFKSFLINHSNADAFDEAMKDCTYAIHCPSERIEGAAGDGGTEKIEETASATQSFLSSVRNSKSVRKVVVTSFTCPVIRTREQPPVCDETTLTEQPAKRGPKKKSMYGAIEGAVWSFAEENPTVGVAVINPCTMIGPSPIDAMHSSQHMFKSIAEGTSTPGILDISWTFADIRDVSKAHILAMELDWVRGRYICGEAERVLRMRDVVGILQEMGYRPKSRKLDGKRMRGLVKTATFFRRKNQQSGRLRELVGRPLVVSNSKIKQDLQMTFMNPAQSLRDMFHDMAQRGHISPPSAGAPSS